MPYGHAVRIIRTALRAVLIWAQDVRTSPILYTDSPQGYPCICMCTTYTYKYAMPYGHSYVWGVHTYVRTSCIPSPYLAHSEAVCVLRTQYPRRGYVRPYTSTYILRMYVRSMCMMCAQEAPTGLHLRRCTCNTRAQHRTTSCARYTHQKNTPYGGIFGHASSKKYPLWGYFHG